MPDNTLDKFEEAVNALLDGRAGMADVAWLQKTFAGNPAFIRLYARQMETYQLLNVYFRGTPWRKPALHPPARAPLRFWLKVAACLLLLAGTASLTGMALWHSARQREPAVPRGTAMVYQRPPMALDDIQKQAKKNAAPVVAAPITKKPAFAVETAAVETKVTTPKKQKKEKTEMKAETVGKAVAALATTVALASPTPAVRLMQTTQPANKTESSTGIVLETRVKGLANEADAHALETRGCSHTETSKSYMLKTTKFYGTVIMLI